jgi:ABC-type multidrug transport system fused ATPase/permease subunit
VSGNKDFEIEDSKKHNDDAVEKHVQTLSCSFSLRTYSTIANIVIFSYIVFTAIRLFKENVLTKEKSTQLVLTSLGFLSHYFWLMANFGRTVEDLGVLNENEKFFKSLEKTFETSKTKLFTPGAGTIKFTDVSFSYNSQERLLCNFNLTIRPKEKVAFVGPSGSGKSTLVKLILGFYPLTSGKIEIDGQDIAKTDLDSLRKNITYISQNTKLFDQTILYNIGYGNNTTREHVENFITRVGIRDVFANLPNGLETNAGINGDNLSGGQKQVVHILRGFLQNNNIVILDEPTSAIDIKHTAIIKNLIRKLSVGKTLILITHESEMLSLVDRRIDMRSLCFS